MRVATFLCKSFWLLVILMTALAGQGQVSVGVSVRIGPPALPVYVQPVCPGPGYIWAPGYWAYGPDGYYWVPGTWVYPPTVGVLWTPGYWGWHDGFYVWHEGYWGPHVGFYGGINYGFGYTGVGFVGGYWRGRDFYYNRAVTNVNVVNVRNVYHTTVINNVTVNRISYNGGTGGTRTRATFAEQNAFRERHFEATHEQFQHREAARSDRMMLASTNHGHPTVGASARPGAFHGEPVAPGHMNPAGTGATNGREGYRTFSKNTDRNVSDNRGPHGLNGGGANNSPAMHEDVRMRHVDSASQTSSGNGRYHGNAEVYNTRASQNKVHENKGHGHADNGDHGHPNDKHEHR